MKSKYEIFNELKVILQKIVDQEIEIDLSTKLIASENLIDSITVMELITWSNDYYKIDLIEDDLYFSCLETVGTLVDKIYMLQEA